MDVIIRGQDVKITDTLADYTQQKLGRLDRYLPHIAEIRVDLSRQHNSRGDDLMIAQITLRHNRGAILRAEEKVTNTDRDSLHAAINLAVDKMYRQIERFKGKHLNNRKKYERFAPTVEELATAEDIPAEVLNRGDKEAGAEEEFVIRRKNILMTAMTEDEAIEQMELLGHNFFVFHNAATGSMNVIYRRDIGGYGVLIPELG